MKQNITIDQLNELSKKGKERLRRWWKPQYGDQYFPSLNFIDLYGWCLDPKGEEKQLKHLKKKHYPLLSIGQMIEFLVENYPTGDLAIEIYLGEMFIKATRFDTKDICDALWEAVKEILEK